MKNKALIIISISVAIAVISYASYDIYGSWNKATNFSEQYDDVSNDIKKRTEILRHETDSLKKVNAQ